MNSVIPFRRVDKTAGRTADHLPPIQGALALAYEATASTSGPHLALVPDVIHPWSARAGQLMQALLDVDAGLRPAQQLIGVTSPAVHRQLLRRQERTRSIAAVRQGTVQPRAKVKSLRVCEVSPDVAEVSAVVHRINSRGQQRAGAAAIRIERRDDHWRVTAFEC